MRVSTPWTIKWTGPTGDSSLALFTEVAFLWHDNPKILQDRLWKAVGSIAAIGVQFMRINESSVYRPRGDHFVYCRLGKCLMRGRFARVQGPYINVLVTCSAFTETKGGRHHSVLCLRRQWSLMPSTTKLTETSSTLSVGCGTLERVLDCCT